MAHLIDRKRAAALLRVTPQAVDKAIRAGRVTYADPAKRLFDEAALLACWETNRRRRRRASPGSNGAGAVEPNAANVTGDTVPTGNSVPELQHRRLRAEVVNLERKARTGHGALLPAAGIERALFSFHTLGRAAIDAMHPQLLERVDDFCPESDSRYGSLYTDTFKLGRTAWATCWMALYQCMRAENPQWADRWFAEFAAMERGNR